MGHAIDRAIGVIYELWAQISLEVEKEYIYMFGFLVQYVNFALSDQK